MLSILEHLPGSLHSSTQVAHLLSSLNINPSGLPGELPHVHDQSWHGVWDQQAIGGGVRGADGGRMMAEEFAAGAQQAAWEGVWGEPR